MRHLPKWGVLFVLGIICLITVFLVNQQSYRYHDLRVYLDESVEAAISASYDNSKRVEEGTTNLDKEKFEKLVKQEMKNTNIKTEIKDYQFSYLENDSGALRGVKVTIVDDQDTSYSAAYKTNNKSERG